MKKYLLIILRIIPAFILLQTLFFKFTAHPDSVALFTELGLEPHGRIGTGIFDLIAGITILMPRTAWLGAGLVVGMMAGAIMSHLTQLGIDVNGDGGALFTSAVIAFVTGFITLLIHRKEIPIIGAKLP